jgi:hypothetical protein
MGVALESNKKGRFIAAESLHTPTKIYINLDFSDSNPISYGFYENRHFVSIEVLMYFVVFAI